MARAPHLVIAAGGTGGHMTPADALAQEMTSRGFSVSLITDERGLRYPGILENCPRHVVAAGSIGGINPLGWARAVARMAQGRTAARGIYARTSPVAVIGFGGYPTVPALLGAFAARIPTIVHDSNAVLGRVNRLFAGRVDAIAVAFPDTRRVDPRHAAKLAVVGNPVRPDIVRLRDRPFPATDGDLEILVIGGSQGAKVLSDVVPAAIALLPDELRRRLRVTQQCRPEDLAGVRAAYSAIGVRAELATFLQDMADRLDRAHLVIARSGASTVSELTVVGRPAIFVPLPIATDDHQVHNTREMVAAGGARMILQPQFTPTTVADAMREWLGAPAALAAAAAAARSAGRPDATARLADLVERIGKTTRPAASDAQHQHRKAVA
jgi:UDP-N-acetylglucosamine--N-acetylmuramyl-(pentapeptide) pyrophosphoryl-undecaprenol N-acetylglucosamine transferase